MVPKRKCSTLESTLAGTGIEKSRKLRLPGREMQQVNAVDSCTHVDEKSELEGAFFLRAAVGMKSKENTSQVTAFQDIEVLLMGWQQGKVTELANEENKQFDLGE